jgi:hypothetical protein
MRGPFLRIETGLRGLLPLVLDQPFDNYGCIFIDGKMAENFYLFEKTDDFTIERSWHKFWKAI